MEKKASSFSGQIGFVLAAAGSAVGVGNLWRFPYLAAKDGGGLFLLVYLMLVLTFGFTLLTSDIAIGRRTKQSAIRAYETMRPKWKFLGILTFLVPVLIMTYYAVIGGWITKYAAVYLTGQSAAAAEDGYFTSFITSPVSPVVFALLFMGVTAFIVYNGVEGGIERVSRYMMPILLVLVVVIAGYALTLRHEDASGQMRTGLEGLRYYLTPHMEGLTVSRFLQILLDAMSQLFFSLSVSMGIMITYGSYMKKETSIEKSVSQIEIFDTGVALLAGLMIVPAVFVFSGGDQSAMQSGPGLMFQTLPKVFDSMGGGQFGQIVGALFFLLVLFAALTSAISLMETVVSIVIDKFHVKRAVACIIVFIGMMLLALPSSLGNGVWSHIQILGMDFLTFFDFISNSVIMPIVALLTCIFIGYVVKTQLVVDEVKSSSKFSREKLFVVVIKYIAPIFIVAILVSSVLSGLGIITI